MNAEKRHGGPTGSRNHVWSGGVVVDSVKIKFIIIKIIESVFVSFYRKQLVPPLVGGPAVDFITLAVKVKVKSVT